MNYLAENVDVLFYFPSRLQYTWDRIYSRTVYLVLSFLDEVHCLFLRLCIYCYFELCFRRFRKIAKSDCELRFACLSLRPSAWNNSAPTGRILMKFDI